MPEIRHEEPFVIALQHVPCEGVGTIGEVLRGRGVHIRVVCVHRGDRVPSGLDGARGLVIMGGPLSAYETDRFPHLREELRLIEGALHAGVPVLGVCLGSQLLAAALGARVYAAGHSEIGWYDVRLRTATRADAMWKDVEETFPALHWHGDIFDLPRQGVSLARSAMTEHQAFRWGERAYGLLFHIEVSRPHVEAMVRAFHDEIGPARAASILSGLDLHIGPVERLGSLVFDRWTDLVLS